MLAGSNPTIDGSTVKYATVYRAVPLVFERTYADARRVVFYYRIWIHNRVAGYSSLLCGWRYRCSSNQQVYPLGPDHSPTRACWEVSLMDLGFGTHGVRMNRRLIHLTASPFQKSHQTYLACTAKRSDIPPEAGHFYVAHCFLMYSQTFSPDPISRPDSQAFPR